MTNGKRYNLFILISTLARNIVEIFSSVILYEKGYSVKDILLFFAILYGFGIVVNIVSIYLGRIIKQKNILIISSLIYGYAFYYLSTMSINLTNLVIYSILLSVGSYTYHAMRHYLALSILPKDNKKEIGSILICSYIAIIVSSYLGGYITNNLGIMWTLGIVIISSLISIIPIIKLEVKNDKKKIKYDYKEIKKNKITFFIFEQFKVIFLSIQPLFLYIYAKSDIEYIGIFNALLGVASVLFVYFISRKVNLKKIFWIGNLLFCLVLIFKINITSSSILLIIAFLEGLLTKMYEMVSTTNIYSKDYKDISSYLILTEFIFCLVRSLICLFFYFFISDVKLMLYICIGGILISGFVRYEYKDRLEY